MVNPDYSRSIFIKLLGFFLYRNEFGILVLKLVYSNFVRSFLEVVLMKINRFFVKWSSFFCRNPIWDKSSKKTLFYICVKGAGSKPRMLLFMYCKNAKKSSFPFRMFASKVSVHKTFCFEQITLKRKVEAINRWLQVPVVRNLKFRTRYSKAYCPLPKQQCCLVTKTMLTQMLTLKTKTELGATKL